ncbi:hypothetical protein G6F57_021069 [Rhizopus arrhizus]|nr:hypothetical protein G6F57_021069 [Rhizopus arrhizus]
MHADPRYALEFRNKAEQHITLKLRKKFFNTTPEGVVDAFNNALMKFLQTRTFKDEGFQHGQPAGGWAAHELAVSKLGGYLAVDRARRRRRTGRQHLRRRRRRGRPLPLRRPRTRVRAPVARQADARLPEQTE